MKSGSIRHSKEETFEEVSMAIHKHKVIHLPAEKTKSKDYNFLKKVLLLSCTCDAVVCILQVFCKGEGGNNNGTFSWIWGRILGIGTKRPENA